MSVHHRKPIYTICFWPNFIGLARANVNGQRRIGDRIEVAICHLISQHLFDLKARLTMSTRCYSAIRVIESVLLGVYREEPN